MYIILYDDKGQMRSAGYAFVHQGTVQLAHWTFGGVHVLRRPLGQIRRIALDWVADGGDRTYQGDGFRVIAPETREEVSE